MFITSTIIATDHVPFPFRQICRVRSQSMARHGSVQMDEVREVSRVHVVYHRSRRSRSLWRMQLWQVVGSTSICRSTLSRTPTLGPLKVRWFGSWNIWFGRSDNICLEDFDSLGYWWLCVCRQASLRLRQIWSESPWALFINTLSCRSYRCEYQCSQMTDLRILHCVQTCAPGLHLWTDIDRWSHLQTPDSLACSAITFNSMDPTEALFIPV